MPFFQAFSNVAEHVDHDLAIASLLSLADKVRVIAKTPLMLTGGFRSAKAMTEAVTDGAIDVRPWLGEAIGVAGIGDALAGLSDPASPIRTVVDPRLP